MQKTQEGYIVADHERILGIVAPAVIYSAAVDERWAKPFLQWGLQVTGVGDTPTAWSVVVAVSLDGGNNYTEILTHDDMNQSDGEVIFVENIPGVHYRVEVKSLTLGMATAIDVGFVGA